jgi:hypothetical protein
LVEAISHFSDVLLSRRLYALYSHPSSPFNFFIEYISGIDMEGWVAVGRALSSKKNLKKLGLCE